MTRWLNTPLLAFILEHGGNPNGFKNDRGPYPVTTPLSNIALRGTLDQLRLLLSYGAKPEALCLHFILRRKQPDPERRPMLSLLLDFGADINGLEREKPVFLRMRTSGGNLGPFHFRTALMEAKMMKDEEATALLLERGADAELKVKSGYQRGLDIRMCGPEGSRRRLAPGYGTMDGKSVKASEQNKKQPNKKRPSKEQHGYQPNKNQSSTNQQSDQPDSTWKTRLRTRKD